MHVPNAVRAVIAGMLVLPACSNDVAGPVEEGNVTVPAATVTSTETTFSGEAAAVKARVKLLGINVTAVEAGPLDSSGGHDSEVLLTATVPKLLTAGVLHASTTAQGNASESAAGVTRLSLGVHGIQVSAALLIATARAACDGSGEVVLEGRSIIAALRINQKSIVVTGKPNQVVPLLLGKVIINEQKSDGESITVNALRIVIPGLADVVISSASAGIVCGAECPPPIGDFTTGLGVLPGPTGTRAEFSFSAGITESGIEGRLVFLEVDGDPQVKGTGFTAYEIDGQTRRIEGTATINGAPGTYVLVVTDGGTGPADHFDITLSTGYRAVGNLLGGNISIFPSPVTCP
ncbi:MAG: hypothetical protein L0271_00945 [Gemmatimonadetes bacterium]|nr:hypothetical protein [Gemmatimonadota bacterium]